MSKIDKVDYDFMNWGPFLLKTTLPNYIIEKLKKEGIKAKDNYNHALAGHLNNQFLYPAPFQKWFYNEIHPIITAYRKGHCKYHGLEELNIELGTDDLWVNFMKAGDFNPLHTHGADYSFVVFVDVPKALEKEIKDFKGTSAGPGMLMFEYGLQARPKWATTGVIATPKTGDMYMFPADMPHTVYPYSSDVTRISMSFNIFDLQFSE